METRSKRRRLLQSYVSSQWPDLPAIFESLNDDTLTTTLEFVGGKSYRSFGGVNKHCKEVYLNTPGTTKETFLFGYGPLSRITDRVERSDIENDLDLQLAVGKGVVYHNRRDVMDWALEERNKLTLKGICDIATHEERFDLLEEVFNGVEDLGEKEDVFKALDFSAVCYNKMNVLKWMCTKGLSIDKVSCAEAAAVEGHIHILKWLREEKGLELDVEFYCGAICGGHIHVMKWLREQGCPWEEFSFQYAAKEGNLDVLQWLHDEGCPWTEYFIVSEEDEIKPGVIDWLHTNGYGNRLIMHHDDLKPIFLHKQ